MHSKSLSLASIQALIKLKTSTDLPFLKKHLRLMTSSILFCSEKQYIDDEMLLLLEVKSLMEFLDALETE